MRYDETVTARGTYGFANRQELTMALWTKLRTELDRAGRAAQSAFDEGRLRLEALRARQLADRAAQALGYALYRAKVEGREIDTDLCASLTATLSAHEAEIASLEAKLADERAGVPEAGRPADP
jgi:hypothetical protein